jgi:hypothetical protein
MINPCSQNPVIWCYNGQCLPEGTCLCNQDFATYECPTNIECCYEKKDGLTTLLLHIFLGLVGASYFYLELHIWAVLSLLFFLIIFCFYLCGYTMSRKTTPLAKDCTKIAFIFAALFSGISFIFWVYFFPLIITRKIKDGNGITISDF